MDSLSEADVAGEHVAQLAMMMPLPWGQGALCWARAMVGRRNRRAAVWWPSSPKTGCRQKLDFTLTGEESLEPEYAQLASYWGGRSCG